MLMEVSSCPECKKKVTLFDNLSSRMGFAHKLELCCENCDWKYKTFTSDTCTPPIQTDRDVSGKRKQGRKPFEVNVRTVLSFREIGRGHEHIKNVSRIMNMCSIGLSCYNNINNELYDAYEKAAECSMKTAGQEVQHLKDICGNDGKHLKTCRVSFDGSWQKRGHNSNHGVETAVSNGKCIDVHVLSKHCKRCRLWEKRKDTDEYVAWKSTHKCNINHHKSAGSMEAVGALAMYQRSIEKHRLIYSEYLGDGDTSSFKEIVDADPYKKYYTQVIKLECCGHVQKRLGTQLRNKVKEFKGTKTPLSGAGKLTTKIINSMQNFYGLAIRQNTGNLYSMKKAVGAILYHCTKFNDETSKDEEYRHRFCPPSSSSWCKYKKLVSSGSETTNYVNTINVPEFIHDIEPIFRRLSSDDLLSKCLHGQTQNGNESLNNLIWTKCPKNTFVERPIIEMGVNSAVIDYNEGSTGIFSILKMFDISPGSYSIILSEKRNSVRVKNMLRKCCEKGKNCRKQLCKVKKGIIDTEKDVEKGDSYVPGGL